MRILPFLLVAVFALPGAVLADVSAISGTSAGSAASVSSTAVANIASVSGEAWPSGGGCTTQSLDQSQTEETADAGYFYSTYTSGQSFVAGDTGDLYSIILKIGRWEGTVTGTATLRFGTTRDLSSSYTEVTGVTIPAAGNEMEFVFDAGSRPSITATTTYYFAGGCPSCDLDNRPTMERSLDDSGYASGTGYYGNGWGNDTDANWDLYFKVMICD